MTIFGTRPEAIKMAPVIKALHRRADTIESKICVTAQHRDLLDQPLALFHIQPDYDLQIMQQQQTLSYITANVLTKLETIILQEHPDWILVQGDTTTAMAAALAGFYHRVRVGHVEAGLRTHDRYNPYPEEINRRIADSVCDLHFAPTRLARENLLSEGFKDSSISVTGNTVIDALLDIVQREDDPTFHALNGILMPGRRVIVVTAHRRENFGAPLEQICAALLDLAHRYTDTIQIVYPVHPNPKVKSLAYTLLNDTENITLVAPLDYLPFVHLMNSADLILTDSGGIQEEAPSLGKPVLVLRETTERPEGVEAGTLKVIGTDRQSIVRETARLLDDTTAYEAMAGAVNPYGDGHAGERIVDILLKESDIS